MTYSKFWSRTELFGVFVLKQNWTGIPNLNFDEEITDEKSKESAGYSSTYDRQRSYRTSELRFQILY